MADGLDEFFRPLPGDDDIDPIAYQVEVTDNASAIGDTVGARELYGNQHHHDAVNWMPSGADYPKRGDVGLLTLSDSGEAWLIAWGSSVLNPDLENGAVEPHPMSLHTGAGFAGGQVPVWDGDSWEAMTPAAALPPNGAAGGDLGNNYPNPIVKKLSQQETPFGVSGLLRGLANGLGVIHANYNVTTDRLVNIAQPGWAIALGDADRFVIYRAPATAGAPVFSARATVSAAGAANFIGAITQNGVAVVLTNDARLSDARTPLAHATSHASGGSDPLAADSVHGDMLGPTAVGKSGMIQPTADHPIPAGVNSSLWANWPALSIALTADEVLMIWLQARFTYTAGTLAAAGLRVDGAEQDASAAGGDAILLSTVVSATFTSFFRITGAGNRVIAPSCRKNNDTTATLVGGPRSKLMWRVAKERP